MKILKISLLAVFILAAASLAFAACWQQATEDDCTGDGSCTWRHDDWGGWCEEKGCWSYHTSDECPEGIPGTSKNCTWQSSSDWGWCENANCYSFEGTNQSACENNTQGVNCEWQERCNGWNPYVECWNLNDSACGNTSGCKWGMCEDHGCWDYSEEGPCEAAIGMSNRNCSWNGYCYDKFCGDYSETNQSACESNSEGLTCTWVNDAETYKSCEERECRHFNFNQAGCGTAATYNLSCWWDGTKYCNPGGCMNYNSIGNCNVSEGCAWRLSSGEGWCEEVNCWTWDGWKGGSQDACEGNGTLYGLGCAWEDMGGGDGWCYPDFNLECSNITTERGCMDTFYCWWEFVDWNSPQLGGNCTAPGEGTFFEAWNPGCYIFDMNVTHCNATSGCYYSAEAQCEITPAHANEQTIRDTGLNCSMLNSSTLCNGITMLSSCCEWNNGSCTENKMTTSCWDDMEPVPEGVTSCGDVSVQGGDTPSTLCNKISGDPWYMPCVWDNATSNCEFKGSDVFGNRTQNFALIDNQKTCEAAGGKWYVDNYCEGNQSVPVGRCEQKGKNEKNCDKACFACEFDFNARPHNSTQTAKEYCYNSKLGYCEFVTNSTAPNGLGYCRAKDAFKKGIASDCKTDCGSCTYMGNPNASSSSSGSSYSSCNTPKCYCEKAYLFETVSCKWVEDSASSVGGYCTDSSVKICSDACDRCYSQTDCVNKGRSGLNATGSCSWSTSQDKCSKTGEAMEVCWDGISNNNNTLIDCNDPQCYADSFCGFVSGDCFGWGSQTLCEDNGCTWMTDPWNPSGWCDFPGANCWKYDGNQNECVDRNQTCDWSSGSGSGQCEQNWSMGGDCYMKMSNATCADTTGCYWSEDMWCNGTGAGSDWCETQGGWCDPEMFKPSNCWIYDTNSTTCESTDGCSWESQEWSGCEVDWSAGGSNCMQYSSLETCNAGATGCKWRTFGEGDGWCDNKYMACWDFTTEATCDTDLCNWDSWMTQCQPKCFSPSYSDADSCNQVDGCRWSEGWCMDNMAAGGVDCWNESMSNNDTNCNAQPECKWKSPGWCNPKGFAGGDAMGGMGGGAMTGMECWKYDGNESMCTNSSRINITCSWMPEFRPFCEPDWSAECWQFDWNYSSCDAENACYWKNNTGGSEEQNAQGYCTNVFDQCWGNQTLAQNNTLCNDNPYCNWSSWMGEGFGFCEPNCFSASDQASCTGSCMWMNGLCNPPGMGDMFMGMEMGPPVMVSADICDGSEGAASYVDMCGVGMKDMGDAFGFASTVRDFSMAGICNNEKIGFMGMQFGNGNQDVKYYVYLDTDGSTTGGCDPVDDDTQSGYEFMLKYVTTWDQDANKATEKFTAQRCSSGSWTTADISLNSMKQKMCGEIQGMLIAINKIDLEKFPALYDSSKDMRIYAAMANGTYNISSPSDTAGPGWVTPGAVDFAIQGFFEKGADGAKFEDVLMNCFVQYEDCYNQIDDDGDGNVDCYDWDCQFASQCAGIGVNIQEDTSMPRISGVSLEEYPDSALVIYYTNKPANGTLTFWHNDSSCTSTPYNRSIQDVGIRLDTVRQHKLWHVAEIYNDSGLISLDYDLANNTPYFYKLKICDSSGKCSVSGCTNFTTTASMSKCAGYCNFVTKIKAPANWTVSYDLDRDGTFEHIQGYMCGPKAGMKTNYTDGRKAHLKLNNTDGGTLWFYNVTITRSGLSVHTRNITQSGSLIYNDTVTDSSGNSIGLVGMIGDTRDKIVNNLHPEICHITVPRGDTDCTELWHCDDSGGNCVDQTLESTAINKTATTCTWQIPYCEFSTYGSGEPGTPSSGTPPPATTAAAGGGGGGGGVTGAKEIFAFKQILPGTGVEISTVNEQLLIQDLSFDVTEEIKDARVTVSRQLEQSEDTPEEVPSEVFGFMEIVLSNILEEQIKSPKIVFKVNRSWLSDNSIPKDTVKLYRYDDGVWDPQPTKMLPDTGGEILSYESTPVGLSHFAIAGDKPPERIDLTEPVDGEEEAADDAEKPGEKITAKVVEELSEGWKWEPLHTAVVMILAVFIVIGGIVAMYLRNKKK
ncbi:MAG: PGF-pre-PGF domain-containing protein [Candidatus Woesearchaeota archaeon]